jgi:decaprenylphospho-beta-D-erythro-pentofuranosid-2-ulose 2-reductase
LSGGVGRARFSSLAGTGAVVCAAEGAPSASAVPLLIKRVAIKLAKSAVEIAEVSDDIGLSLLHSPRSQSAGTPKWVQDQYKMGIGPPSGKTWASRPFSAAGSLGRPASVIPSDAMTEPAQRILIFGATSAIAEEVARLYAARGARLYLVGRNAEKLGRIAGALGSAVVAARAADLDDTSSAQRLVDEAAAVLGGVDVAVIAHGLLGDQAATERDYGEAERVLRTNFLSVVALLVPLANYLEAAGHGQIAVMSSVAGDRGRPRNYTYGTAKGALNVYLQGLRTRLWSRGVGVHTLKLGPVDTPMTADHRKTALFVRAPAAAADIVTAIDRGRAEAYVPWFWRPIMATVQRLPERVVQRFPFLSGR